MRVTTARLLSDLRRTLHSAAPAADAEDVALAALWLVQAEQLGLGQFGITMLVRELDRLGADEGAPPLNVADDAPIGSIDATAVPGVVALASAVRRVSAGVTAHGLALVGIRGAGALGVLGLAARTLASRGTVALVAAQSPAAVAPWGARAAAIGTNPLAIAVPRAEGTPLVVDYATSSLTLAAVHEARRTGAQLPERSALDAAGEPTTDPAAVAAVLPTGLVGSLTGLVVELLAGVAVGGRVTDPDARMTRGAVIVAFEPARAGGTDTEAAAAALDRDWRAAGGHLPARFDVLGDGKDDLPDTLDIDDDAAAWLSDRVAGSPPA
ncbi:Ldh family oxidoreductase [Microbacterium sp. SSW1-49]|uniref:Ldh family oxidoreductase n=1 Tax=Microbacterium croceum TaxID=2851645 RepID=A0ABT0FGN4_9MICO|nr:Ldh family oxidoreductase [Microbacterium croceum]MCK2036872.1 Ldh family oxidoreductase [Microbacterium croceum]